jgi:ABC transporter DrrB family efflux protein
MQSIKVDDLVVVRGGATVLDRLSFTVPAGSVTGLLGPSGSGKTTLLRVIAGVQRITSGTVTVLDRPAGHPSLRHEIGYTTQVPSVYSDLSVADNVRYHATLERLFTTPLGRGDLVFGYGLAFAVLALVQAGVACAVALGLLGMDPPASVTVLVLIAVANALLGMALGLGLSSLATTEFQAVQFLPAVALPQVLLCGLIVPTDQMAGWLDAISRVMPLRYAVDAMTTLTGASAVDDGVWTDLAIISGCVVVALAVGATTLRRRTA